MATKRPMPATPFHVVGPSGSFTTSSESPMTQPAGGSSEIVPAHASLQQPSASTSHACVATSGPVTSQEMASSADIGQVFRFGEGYGHPGSPSVSQYNTQYRQENTFNQENTHQNFHAHHSVYQQVNQVVDPQQLEALVASLVEARVESNYHQMRMAAQQEIATIRDQAGSNQQALEEALKSRLAQIQSEVSMRDSMQQQAVHQARDEADHLRRQNEAVVSEAEARLQRLAQDRDLFMQQAEQAEQNAARLRNELQIIQRHGTSVHTPSFVAAGSVRSLNPFDTPKPPVVTSNPATSIAGSHKPPSVASQTPLEVRYCGVCGVQNVRGRPTCWRCNSSLNEAINGTVELLRDETGGSRPTLVYNIPPLPGHQSCAPSARQVAPCSAYNAAPQGSGGLGMCYGNVGAGNVTVTPHRSTDVPAGIPVHVPAVETTAPNQEGSQHFRVDTPRSQASASSRSSGGCPSSLPSNWLNVGETDEHVYKIKKHLKGVHITKLPTDATSCREWRAAFLAAASRIDLTSRDVLVKFSVYCMDSGRGRRFREMLQASNDFVMFNKHVAAELIKPEVLSTNSDLAHELTSWVEACASRQEGPKGMALMNIIIGYYETGTDHSVALNQMHLLGLNLEGKTQKDLTDFVKKANYILHGLKPVDRPAEATMYSWLWHQIKRVPMLSRMVDKVKSSAKNSRKRSFEWIWTQIAEEIRERRHDSNYENVSKGLKAAPSNLLALAAPKADPSPNPKGKGEKPPKPPKNPPAVPGQVSDVPSRPDPKAEKEKVPCALHAAGHCRFGERCRNSHIGEPGSDQARKAFSEYQAKGKGEKGKGKSKKGKDAKNGKGSKSNLATPAAVAAAASTVNITEVEGRRVMTAWEGFCNFCKKALPSLDMFLKLSIPILATVVSSVVNSIDQIGEVSAAAMLKEPIKDFRTFSLEFLGDTGAAYDIGSLKALEEQGIDRKTIEPWIKVLDHPVNFSTGGGRQMATEALRVYCENLGELHMHLLSSCPMALSIGRQVSKGKTFIWEHGQKPYLALNHRRCRVWCPRDNRWYAKRVQHNVPIFAIEDHRLREGDMSKTTLQADAGLFQPAMAAVADEEQFCGSCLERIPACICSTCDTHKVEPPGNTSSVVVQPSRSIEGDCQHREEVEVPVPEVQHSVKEREHLRKRDLKERKRCQWDKKRKVTTRGAYSGSATDMIRGDEACRKLVKEIHDFYAERGKEAENEDRQVYQNIADYIKQEDGQQTEPAEIELDIAQYEPHHQGMPGHGSIIEFCAATDSMMGRVAKEVGVHVVRCTEDNLNIEHNGTIKSLVGLVQERPGVDVWGSLPCKPWTLWQCMNLHRYGKDFADKLEQQRRQSRLMLRKFCQLSRAVARHGGRVTFEWPRYCAGWALKELQALVKELGLVIVDFDGCRVGLCNDKGVPHLKQWRLVTSDNRIARIFSGLRCLHDKGFKHAIIEGSSTNKTGFYPREMCEYIMHALYPDILAKNVPAMPVIKVTDTAQEHRENEPEKDINAMPMVIEYEDTMALAGLPADSDADDEAELRESREARLAREARSLDHMMLHHRKNPMCEHCQRGRMLKRYFHRVRGDPEEEDVPYTRPTEFGAVIEADNIFPQVESRGMGGEQTALLVRDRFSGVTLVYPQTERTVDSNYQALKHFSGYRLSGKSDVVFHSDSAQELTKAASLMCWVPDPSGPNAWPHNSHLEREVRAIKELCRPSHIQAGFHRRLWTISMDFVAKAKSFFTAAPIAEYEKGTPAEEAKTGKTRWCVATGRVFDGPRYPLGALVFYRARGDGMAAATTKPGLFIGWHLSPGLRYRGNLLLLDYESIRGRNHLYWVPKILHEKETFLPPMLHIEFPLARAARNSMLNMDDEEQELRKREYDRSIIEGVLPYDICIDSYPIEDRPTPERHAYITWARLLQHGFTEGCPGCAHGHHRHSKACRARFDQLFPRRGDNKPEGESDQLAIEDADDCSYAPTTPPHSVSGETEVPECPPDSDDDGVAELADDAVPGMVTRQLPRAEVLSRPDALDAIRKEFDGISQMGTWDLKSVQEEEEVRRIAISENETIHLADLLAICSEKHVELEPKFRSLKGRVCYRGDAARTAKGEIALYQTLSASPASIVAANAIIAYGLLKGHSISTADAVKAYLQSWLQSHAATWVRLPREVWPDEWFGSDGKPLYKRPVSRVLCGDCWCWSTSSCCPKS